MNKQCDNFEHCRQVCEDSIHHGILEILQFETKLFFIIANSQSHEYDVSSSLAWMVMIVIILLLLLLAIITMTVRYKRRRRSERNRLLCPRMLNKNAMIFKYKLMLLFDYRQISSTPNDNS